MRVPAFAASRRSTTTKEAPTTGPRPLRRPPKQRPESPKGTRESPRHLQDHLKTPFEDSPQTGAKFFTLRVSPPAHPKTATFAKHTDCRGFRACFLLPSHISSCSSSLLPPCTSSLWEQWEEEAYLELSRGMIGHPAGTLRHDWIFEGFWPLGALLGLSRGSLGALLGRC